MSELAKRLRDPEEQITRSDRWHLFQEAADALDAAEAAVDAAHSAIARGEPLYAAELMRVALAKIRGK